MKSYCTSSRWNHASVFSRGGSRRLSVRKKPSTSYSHAGLILLIGEGQPQAQRKGLKQCQRRRHRRRASRGYPSPPTSFDMTSQAAMVRPPPLLLPVCLPYLPSAFRLHSPCPRYPWSLSRARLSRKYSGKSSISCTVPVTAAGTRSHACSAKSSSTRRESVPGPQLV